MFERCGLEFSEVEAESGMMGGKESMDFLAPSGSGENTLVTCENGDYAADLEIARGIPRAPEFPDAADAPKEVATPGVTTIEALAEQLGIDEAATSKAMPVVTTDGKLVLGLVRGDDRLSEPKLVGVLESDYRPATDEEIRSAFGADGGSLGPIGVDVEVVADEALREGQYVAGANRDGWHLLGVEAGRDYEPRFADIREAREGDRCPVCGGALRFQTAIEVGHIFKFGTATRSRSARPSSTRTATEKPLIGGSYGIGPGARDGGRGRAAPRRERDRLAGVDRAVRRPRSLARRRARTRCSRQARAGRRAARSGGGSTSSSTTATSARARSSRTRTSIGAPAARHRREEDARGRNGRRPDARRDGRTSACRPQTC